MDNLPGYDAWKLMSPDDEREERRAAARRLLRRLFRDPDAARDAQQDREMRGED